MPDTTTVTTTYVYAVGEDPPPDVPDDLTGVAGGSVRLVREAGLWAAVGGVPEDDFAEDAIATRLEDLSWLAATARAHHHVVDEMGRRAVVAPLALATVYRGDGRVRQTLAERAADFVELLGRFRGRAEWGVKVWAAERAPEKPPARAASGTEYLRRRRSALDRTSRDESADHAGAEELHRAAAGVAVAARRHRLHAPALTGRPERMVLNGAYLVEDADRDRWRAALAEASGDDRLSVEITGPWVPYSFVSPDPPAGEVT
ncbi:GvpL/GvpF family gas vesicle protein [Pseudonocardia nematodicida]|uniref:GvpL/GvpF family gas vesicle protein n=1 Tax=Pseudonocardia nematodicida TaxID=1206997 RepID=A0ABV1KHV7_9PSEU